MIKKMIKKLIENEDYEYEEIRDVAIQIMSGDATPSQIASFITALKIRGESPISITAFASAMREKSLKIKAPADVPVLDTCGTGGDGSNTFNISTAAAIVAAAAGIKVAKHGNRAISSNCGSADVLESLGVRIDCPVETSEKCLEEANFCFMFAPMYHGGMKHAAVARKEIGFRSIFNLLGPLSNPAGASHQLIGVCSPDFASVFADVLATLGTKRALIVYGSGILDEISLSNVTSVVELTPDAETKHYIIDPNDFGFEPCGISDFAGSTKEENAKIIEDIFKGKNGAKTNITLLNAGAAIYIAEKADSIRDGIEIAKEIISSGAALDTLDKIRNITNQA